MYIFFIITLLNHASANRQRISLNLGWRFLLGEVAPLQCNATSFPVDQSNTNCSGLTQNFQYGSLDDCIAGCCGNPLCEVYQWCPKDVHAGGCAPQGSCWLGKASGCTSKSQGWIGRSRKVTPPPPSPSSTKCTDPNCSPGLNDSIWRVVNVPHDFVLEGKFTQNGTDRNHGFLPMTFGWYRLWFRTPTKDTERNSVWIDFEGIQTTSEIYLNGKLLGIHDSGYIGFHFDLLDLHQNESNLIAVKADARHPDSWWYDGGGIYRNVWLTVADRLHVVPHGVFANVTIPLVQSGGKLGNALVDAQITVHNAYLVGMRFGISIRIIDANGRVIANYSSKMLSLVQKTNSTFHLGLSANDVKLWSDVHPVLYTLETTVSGADDTIFDAVNISFGFRKIYFDAERGFILNGVPTKIRGFANHQDFAGVGVAVPDALQRFRVSKIKEMGGNGWRTAHNPPNPALLDECDRQGLLVWDEHHRNDVKGQLLDDLAFMLKRDRNHPSIILWSICNEAFCETGGNQSALVLTSIVKEYDNGPNARPVTAAQNGGWGDPLSLTLDVMGINYHMKQYNDIHKMFPGTKFIASETASAVTDRGIYFTDGKEYVSAYDSNHVGWGATAEDAWKAVDNAYWISGSFVWTGFDYKGEPTPYGWPNVNSHFGVIDIAGFPKDSFWWYSANWQNEVNVVHCLPHWNWDDADCIGGCSVINQTKIIDVWAYANTDFVEVALNGKVVIDATKVPKNGHISWKIPYVPGTLQCRGLTSDKKSVQGAVDVIKTAGKPSNLMIEIEQGDELVADYDDVALLKVSVRDELGILVPTANNVVSINVSGPGVVLGVGNGNPSCHEPDRSTTRSAWNGLMRAIIQSTTDPGLIQIIASSPGLKSASVYIESVAPNN